MMITALPRKDDDVVLVVGLSPKDLRALQQRSTATIPKVDLERVGVTGIHQLIITSGNTDMAMVDEIRNNIGIPVTVETRTRPCS